MAVFELRLSRKAVSPNGSVLVEVKFTDTPSTVVFPVNGIPLPKLKSEKVAANAPSAFKKIGLEIEVRIAPVINKLCFAPPYN